MDTTASRFTLRKNAERAARAMIRKGIAPAVDYGIKSSDDGFEIVWKIAKTAPTTDEVETRLPKLQRSSLQLRRWLRPRHNPRQRPPSPRRLTPHRSPRQRLKPRPSPRQ